MGNLERVATFVNWPSNASVSCLSWASAGFAYTGISDEVRCPLCGLVIKDWQNASMNPLHEHRIRSPQCSFFSDLSLQFGDEQLRETSENMPMPSSLLRDSASVAMETVYQSALERAKRHGAIEDSANAQPARDRVPRDFVQVDRVHPDYRLLRDESMRLSTYYDWPASDIVQPSALAHAGLFYTGQTDRTCCAFCRGVLYHWQTGDVPDDEHRRHFPNCPFIRQRQDVGNVPLQRDAASLSHQMAALGVHDVIQSATGDVISSTTSSASANVIISTPFDQAPVDASAAAAANSTVRQTFTGNSVEHHHNHQHHHQQQQQRTQVTMNITSTFDDEEQMLLEENRRLNEAKTCKVCMDNDVNTVFLPCGHLVSCDQCAPKLRHCPICRTYIRGTVKTFLS